MTPAQLTGAFQAIAHLADYSGGAFNPDIKRICETAIQKASQPVEDVDESPDIICPFCGDNYISTSVTLWEAKCVGEPDPGDTARLGEHQCKSCGRSFWTAEADE